MDNPGKENILDLSQTEISNEQNENKENSEANNTKNEFEKDVIEEEIFGKTFETIDEAYQFYNAYARVVGFSIRKHWASRNKASQKMIARIFCCSCEGHRETHPRGTPSKSRAVTRTGCMARIQVRLGADGNYNVTEFIKEHNHELAPQDKVHFLRSQRKIQPAQAGLIDNMQSAGLGSTEIFSYMSIEAGGSKNLNFIQEDCDNYMQRKRVDYLRKGDATVLLEYFKGKQKENNSFFYSIQLDEDDRISNCFWCDAKSRIDYNIFGDVVCFDTTFKTNGYDMPFAPIVGVNNHGQTVLFGCALLRDETTSSFVWLFETFLNAIGGKHMETIFSDQAISIANAIKQVFVNTHHHLCLWHIYQNAVKHLSNEFSKFNSFSHDFRKCIYENETEEEFQESWQMLLEKYSLEENVWMKNLYQLREKWAQVYVRQHFCAAMTTTQRSESMNSYFKKYFSKKQTLREFVDQYDKAVARRREKETKADFKSMTTKPNLVSGWAVELKAAEVYTRKIFNEFQEEFKKIIDLELAFVDEDGSTRKYKVSSYTGARSRTVTICSQDYTIKCSCKKFEFSGLLCSHALKVLRMLNLLDIPAQYYLRRWTKEATTVASIDTCREKIEIDSDPSLSARYSELSHMALAIAIKGSKTPELSLVAKRALLKSLDEIQSYMDSQPQGEEVPRTINSTSVDKFGECITDLSGADVTIRDPLRKNEKGQQTRRIKGCLEKGKNGRQSQSQLRKRRTGKGGRSTKSMPPSSSDQVLPPPSSSGELNVIPTQGLSSRATSVEHVPCVPPSTEWNTVPSGPNGMYPPNGFVSYLTQLASTVPSQFPARRLEFSEPPQSSQVLYDPTI